MADDQDLVVFQDDDGNELTMEVLDYLFYEGKEYALLAEQEAEDAACESCETGECDGCAHQRDAFVMQVVDAGDDMEEFVPVDDDLAAKLIDIMENSDFDDEEFDEEEIEDAEDGDSDDE